MSGDNWSRLTDQLASTLAPDGLDLVAATRSERYDRAVPSEYRLPDVGRRDALVIVVGNTRALWPAFIAWLADDPDRLDLTDPLDSLVAERVRAAAGALDPRTELRFAHEPPPRRIAVQRLAEIAGLARIAPTHLSIHPEFGPWISLRAAIVVDTPGPPDPAQPPPDPCLGCTESCREVFRRAMDASRKLGPQAAWKEWATLRNACPIGGEHRFCDAQLRYHALVEPGLLRREVERHLEHT